MADILGCGIPNRACDCAPRPQAREQIGAASPVTVDDFSLHFGRRDRAETLADGIVHGLALLAACVGVVILMIMVGLKGSGVELGATIVYSIGIIAMLGFSMAYNLVPPSRLKWHLRRFDHAAIFLMIAGTYTPLVTQMHDQSTAWMLGGTVWIGALAGMAMKFSLPGRYDRLFVLIYLGLSWVAVIAIEPLMAALPKASLLLLLVGGGLYSFGVLFHLWQKLKFQRAIWHGFVASAAGCHFAAITISIT
jgi:hemolysin III